ncbi:MAG: hypothetical protein JSV43_03615 [Methanobacteriota archaeon]|nr:MAG: hypothetical protein JSV43_03615 [Euryarchaeota archaeon]
MRLNVDGDETKWFRNTYTWISFGAPVFLLLVFLTIHLQFSYSTKSAFGRFLEFIVFLILVALFAFGIATLYYKYPTRYGLSSKGIHLKYLGREEILYWNTIRGIERIESLFGSTRIRKLGDKKYVLGLVSNELFREMNRLLKKHRPMAPHHT